MVDAYTKKTKDWLNSRFKQKDINGIYKAHQPIYGFRCGPHEPGLVPRYIRTYRIIQALSHLKFKSLLDVGAAEGYQAALVRQIFNVQVVCSDLSEEACLRAKEIYNIEAVAADIQNLPFIDNKFDVLLCSETLEHVYDYHRAIAELIRVAKKAVIITVPHEPKIEFTRTKKSKVPHSHIHKFNLKSFDYLIKEGIFIKKYKLHSSRLFIPSIIIDAVPITHDKKWKFPSIFTSIYNFFCPIFKFFFRKSMVLKMIEKDEKLCNGKGGFNGILFVLLKDKNIWNKDPLKSISIKDIVDFTVPYHYLKQKI